MNETFINFLVTGLAAFCLVFYIIPYITRLLRGNVIYIEPKDLDEKIKSGEDLLMIDIRPGIDFTDMLGHIDGAVSLPYDILKTKLMETADQLAGFKDTPVVIIGLRDENKVFYAYKMLRDRGFSNVSILNYGLSQWMRQQYPTVERNGSSS